ncbi:hypothetical protein C1645_814221 [Glomus cerebriforme]|uniref:G-patch domain-containing protein n=1 Tax=Glomus cerebriforme TaxID=658196 RepID=A0A397TQL7_9GLOM|nr:hypothetical protein C1645_814221 [Glomus cerebriforme]
MSFSKKKSKSLEENDDDDETFVVYGTELPGADELDKGKFQPVWKQEVRDEKGLRRFHGAFKGGWSAGYFNTVGSKEGWAPSTFVSSRKNRIDRKDFKPEDFMDEEDLEELQDHKLVATDEFDSFGSTERELEKKRMLASSMEESGSVLGALPDKFIDDLVLPNKDPVGVRLLKAMGWREGQGIGPRVSKFRNEDTELFESDKSVLFAPKDTEMIKFDQKSNSYGLDFDPFKNATEFIPQSSNIKGDSYLQHNKFQDSLSRRGEGTIGFGMSDDDDDILYSETSKANFHSSLIDDDEDTIIMGGKKLSKYLPPKTFQEKKSSNGRVYHDGSLSLRGFVLASRPVPLDKWFAPPILPKGFVSIHEFNFSGEKEKIDTQVPFQRGKQQKQTTLAILAEQRGELLGETPLNAPARSVFDYVSRKDKDRLDNLIGYMIDTTGEIKRKQPSEIEIPKVDKDVALAALQGFIPFENDKKKQARYKHFLEVQAELSAVPLKQPEGCTIEEYLKELDEFAQSARIFRPMSKMMASRFTSAKSVEDFKHPEKDSALASESTSQIQDDISIRQESTESSAETAARMNMFGPLTRTRTNFYPSRLLCKRFNVANPHPDYKYDNQPGKTQKGQKDVLSKETMNGILGKQDTQIFMESTGSNFKSQINTEEDKAVSLNTFKQAGDVKEVDIHKTRPAMELFKSIFGESDTEDEEAAPKHKEPPNMVIGTVNDTNLVEEKSPPIPSEPVEVVSTPFRPMFKKKEDRTEKILTSESTEISQSTDSTIHSKRKEKDHVTRVSLSFEDESIIGPSIKRVKSSENDSSSSAESHSHHKHSHVLSKKHKPEKKKKKKKHSKGYDNNSKKKANKRSCEESGDDERRKSSKKKRRHEDEGEYHDRNGKYHRNKDSHHHQITKVDKAKEDVNDRKFENRSERQIETTIHKKREDSFPSLIQSKEKRTTSSPQSKNDSNKSNTSRSRNRPRAMDLW